MWGSLLLGARESRAEIPGGVSMPTLEGQFAPLHKAAAALAKPAVIFLVPLVLWGG